MVFFFIILSKWRFLNISYLTELMVDYLDAPLPYIIGINRNLWEGIKTNGKLITEDTISVFDINKNQFENIDMSVPKLSQEIIKNYNEIYKILKDSYKDDITWLKQSYEVKRLLLKTNLKLIGNFSKYFRRTTDYSCKNERKLNKIFNVENYLNDLPKDSLPFIRELTKTDCFMEFIESMYNPQTNELLNLLTASKNVNTNFDKNFNEIYEESIKAADNVN